MRKSLWCLVALVVVGAFWSGRLSAADDAKPKNRYFEMRIDGRSVDPVQWLKAR